MHGQSRHRFTPTSPAIIILLSLVCYLLFFQGLGSVGLLGPDEPRYAAVAREMFSTGDYVTPRLHGEPWFEKPPLTYWGAALGFGMFGMTEFGARFASAVGGTLCVFLAYYAGFKLWGRWAGLWAALILATSTGFFSFARAASTDMPLTACLTLALLSFLVGRAEKGPSRRWWFYSFYFFLGLGVVAKGPIAWILPALSLLSFVLLRGDRREWREWHPEGLLISIVVAAPWYIAASWANGYEFVQAFLVEHNLQRFLTTTHRHERPFYFYVPSLVMLTFPWTFLVIPALRRALDRTDWILICWASVPILFFSFSGSKLPGYILPSVPAIALLCAKTISASPLRGFRIAVFIEAGTLLFIGVAFGFYGDLLGIDPHVNGRLIAAVAFSFAAVLVAVALWLNPPVLAALNVLFVTSLVVVATNFVLPRFDATDTMRPLTRAITEIIPENQTVFLYRPDRWVFYSMQFYRYNNIHEVHTPEELVQLAKHSPGLFVITDDSAIGDLAHVTGIKLEIVTTIGKHTGVWAHPSHE